MTRPSELRLREGEQPGTPAAAFEIGARLPVMRFTITPEVIEEYISAIDSEPGLYELNGRPAAPPNVLAIYQLAILYRKYPPLQGIILTEQEWRWYSPIWADEETEIEADGEVMGRFERRGKNFIRWSAAFRRKDGTLLATAVNTMCVPE
jgi:hypothetical protein